jgi:hypothetical protein
MYANQNSGLDFNQAGLALIRLNRQFQLLNYARRGWREVIIIIKKLLLLILKLYLHTVFSSGFNMQQTKLDKLQK